MSTCEQRHYTKFQVFWGGGGGVEFQAPSLYETLLAIYETTLGFVCVVLYCYNDTCMIIAIMASYHLL